MEHDKVFPKNVKKTIRYINQEATYEQLLNLRKILNFKIDQRLKSYKSISSSDINE